MRHGLPTPGDTSHFRVKDCGRVPSPQSTAGSLGLQARGESAQTGDLSCNSLGSRGSTLTPCKAERGAGSLRSEAGFLGPFPDRGSAEVRRALGSGRMLRGIINSAMTLVGGDASGRPPSRARPGAGLSTSFWFQGCRIPGRGAGGFWIIRGSQQECFVAPDGSRQARIPFHTPHATGAPHLPCLQGRCGRASALRLR